MVNYVLKITAELEDLTDLQFIGFHFCGRDGTVSMISGRGRPLTRELGEAGTYTPLMIFDCRGFEPVDFDFRSGWKVQSVNGTKFDAVDLSGGDFAEYDEKGECPVMISNLRSRFEVVK